MRGHLRGLLLVVASVAGSATGSTGCQCNVTTSFPAGLEPLEDNTAPDPDGEALVMVTGEDGHKWAHGRGVIFAPPAAVWAAAKDPAHMAAICDTTRHTITVGVEPGYEHSFRIHYEVDDIVNVSWDELWRYGTVTGTADAPSLAMIRYQKVFGSDFISLLEGSLMVLESSDADHTDLEFIEHLSAVGGSIDNLTRSMQHRFNVLQAAVHGAPTPDCPP